MKQLRAGIAVFLLVVFPILSHAGDLEIGKGWARAMLPGARVAAGYVEITNRSGQRDRLVSLTSPRAGRVELHEMRIADGVMVMRPLEGLDIEAGQTVLLEPGGLHLMMMEISGPLKAGETVTLTMEFERAGKVTTGLSVVPPGASGP